MATIHTGTTMAPTKLELLAGWLPRQPWYSGDGSPTLSRAGGFRLDDPDGEVGIEFAFVVDGETVYHVPMTYRAAPLEGADSALLGTSEHGVLGRRWVYDGAHDPVAVAALLDFVSGRAEAQHQSRSDTPDPSAGRTWSSAGRLVAPSPLRVSDSESGRTTVDVESTDGDRSLQIVRVLRAGPSTEEPGSVVADWTLPDGGQARGVVAVVR